MNVRCSCWNIGLLTGAVLLSCSPHAAAAAKAAREVRSPDGKIAITIYTDAPLGYSIAVDGKPALLRSRLGLELAGDVKLGEKPVVKSEARQSADTHWENQFGKNRDVRDHYNELSLTLKEGGHTFGVVARAYDDGVAFRLVLPAQPGMDSFTVTRDATEFTFPDDEPVWAGWNNPEGAARPEGGFIGSQEWRYLPNKLSGLNPAYKHGLPFLVQTPAAYVAITESDLLDWSAMWLAAKAGARNTLEAQLAPPIPARPWPSRNPSAADGAAVSTAPAPAGEMQKGLVVAKTPHNSPWRTFIIGRRPADLIQSDLVLNLATPSQLADTSWVKPGMSSWGTWWSATGRNDLSTLKQYIQLAADMNWPYQLSEIGDKSIVPELVSFAKERGVRVWLWFHFNDFIDSAVYKRDFPMYAKWGIAGLKIDFHRPRRPVGGQVVRRYRQDGGREPLTDRLPRRVQAHRPGTHVAQPDHARGHTGQRVQQVEHQGNARTPGYAAVYARAGRPGRLHAGRVSSTGSHRSSRWCRPTRRCKPREWANWRCSSSS